LKDIGTNKAHTEIKRMNNNIYVVGIGMTQFGRHLQRSVTSLAEEALQLALKDAGLSMGAIQQAYYGGTTQSPLQGQHAVPGQVVFARIGLVGLPVYNIENACASGTSAFQMAVQALRAGACDVALALGAEKMNIEDKRRALALFEGGWDVSLAEENAARLLALGQGIEVPEGSESQRPYSRFMAIYAALCRYWMKSFGTTQRQIAAVAAKNHQHSMHNPLSQYRESFTTEQVLAAPPITYPLTMPMCAPLSDGAAAVIVCTESGLTKLGISRSRAIRVAATAIATATPRGADEFNQAVCRRAGLAAYEKAGISPADVSVAEVHDATAMGEIMAAEFLGLVLQLRLGSSPLEDASPSTHPGDLNPKGIPSVQPVWDKFTNL
jgi:acetyl-CoA acetyltransferase